MASWMAKIPPTWLGLALRAVFALPGPLRRALTGPPVERDGQRLAPEAQLLLRLTARMGTPLNEGTPEHARRELHRAAGMLPATTGGVGTRDLVVPGPAATLPARLYTPDGLAEGSGLLVFFHGGGFVLGSIVTHDPLCRYLAATARVRVLSVDYRLAPEHPFPAAVDDALAAFQYALTHAEALGADPASVAVGGDSAGANLTAAVGLYSPPSARPRFALLLYPAADLTIRHRSRELFASDFVLTEADIDWFVRHYLPPGTHADPRVSVLRAPDVTGFPPCHIVTAGFDPLRDEGEAFAARLSEAGVPVALRRQPDLIHGFASLAELGGRFREAVAEAAGALHAGLTVSPGRVATRALDTSA